MAGASGSAAPRTNSTVGIVQEGVWYAVLQIEDKAPDHAAESAPKVERRCDARSKSKTQRISIKNASASAAGEGESTRDARESGR